MKWKLEKNMNTLYELTNEYLQLLEMAEDPDVNEETLKDTMDAIGGEIEYKADCYAKVMKTLDGDIASLDAEIKRLTSRKQTIKNNVDRIKNALEMAMRACDKPKFKTTLFSFNIQKNPARVVIAENAIIPEEYFDQPDPVLNKTRIKEALKAGIVIDGATMEQSESLRIR